LSQRHNAAFQCFAVRKIYGSGASLNKGSRKSDGLLAGEGQVAYDPARLMRRRA
jgi:hypothetical protein